MRPSVQQESRAFRRREDVKAVTFREDGSPLVKSRSVPLKATLTYTAIVDKGLPLPTTPDGWLFFGWAAE